MEFDINDYDVNLIRDYLEDYYGTAMVNASTFATVDLIDIGNKSDYEIVAMAYNMGILNNYYKGNTR